VISASSATIADVSEHVGDAPLSAGDQNLALRVDAVNDKGMTR
jgi:hypothetical protein